MRTVIFQVHRLPVSSFRKETVAFALLTICSLKVLAAVDQQHKPDVAGQGWYEKGWKPTTSDYADSSVAGGGRLRAKTGMGGSGAGQISDLDDGSPGLGEDDEDTPETEMGSGAGSSTSRFDAGSGRSHDISLPPTTRHSTSTNVTSTAPTVQMSTITSSLVTATATSTISVIVTTTSDNLRIITDRPINKTTEAITTRKTTKYSKVTFTEPSSSTRRPPTAPLFTANSTPRTTSVAPKRPSVLDDRNKSLHANFWMRPGVLAGLIGGAIAGLLAAILLVMFVVYRMRKKDEGSYALEEPKSPPTYAYAYQKAPTREFYA